ncbi:MAG: helix-turn-helix domain-containing protein, partial [Puniceicoccales bacterium]
VYRLDADMDEISEVDFNPFATPWESRLTIPAAPPSSTPMTTAHETREADKVSKEKAALLASMKRRIDTLIDFSLPLPEVIAEHEARCVAEALRRTSGHRQQAAALLGISYRQLKHLTDKHKLRLGRL